MKKAQGPVLKDLVLVGGGHSHVAVLKAFGMKPLPGVRMSLICRDVHTPYSGMLPGHVAGHYAFDEAHIDLRRLARFAGADFYHDEVLGLELDGKRVVCRDRPPVRYDVLSINIGSIPRTYDVPGAPENAVPVKPINRFIAHWERMKERVLAHAGAVRIGVVGAGAGGVEILLSIQYRLGGLLAARGYTADHLEFHLFSDAGTILPTHNRRVRAKLNRLLEARGVRVHTGQAVTEVPPGVLRVADGTEYTFDEILWVTAAAPAPWLADSGLALDGQGFIAVNDALQSTSHPHVFAAGDIASVVNHPRPKSGVFAVRQGKPLARNLRCALLTQPLQTFRPQRHILSLISTGERYAVASRRWLAVEGAYVWRWKDWIDRRFMRKYDDLPELKEEGESDTFRALAGPDAIREISAVAMRCGGCGAKVGASVLSRVLDRVEPLRRNDIVLGLLEPDDAAVVEVPEGKVIVHTVDSFRSFVNDPYVFGKVAANHALGDIFAMGAEPQSALAVATIPYGLEDKVEATLLQMLLGANEVLRREKTALVGGHTSEGAELALGFAVNGLADRDAILRKAGMSPGDRLVLTKAVGTGTLFAADMRFKAKGRWIEGALASMLQSNGPAAGCLRKHGATSCTDVTGFGVLGHLIEMTRASRVSVEIALAALPILDGALETVAMGILSSLQPQNVRLRRSIRNLAEVSAYPAYPLLFDPQTSGGLLASVPAGRADGCVAELRGLRYAHAAVIGVVKPEGEGLEPVTLLT